MDQSFSLTKILVEVVEEIFLLYLQVTDFLFLGIDLTIHHFENRRCVNHNIVVESRTNLNLLTILIVTNELDCTRRIVLFKIADDNRWSCFESIKPYDNPIIRIVCITISFGQDFNFISYLIRFDYFGRLLVDIKLISIDFDYQFILAPL